ncbi:MAG: hypothetical protein KGJ79_10525 [Alphaproteobacteria bacterium]|nr:hypothetical protein [Alphaproteobacteria bacterium]
MRGLFNRALIFAAGVAASAIALTVCAPAATTHGSVISTPASRIADYSFSLDLPSVLPGLSSGPQDLSRYATNEVAGTFALFDGLTLETGFNVDVAGMLDRYAPSANAFDGLFYSASATTSPYLSLSSGGSYVGASVAMTNNLYFSIGRAASAPGLNPYLLNSNLAVARLGDAGLPYDTRNTNSLVAGLAWNFAKWGGVGFTASQTIERAGALGVSNDAIDMARTTALGFSAHVGFGGGWVTTASYSEGTTQLDLRPSSFSGGLETELLHTQSYGIAVAKQGLFGNDALGLAFSRPAPNYGGAFSAATSNDMQFFGRDKLFAGTTPETDIELGYVTNFFGNSVALQANAAYQTNLGGQNGTNSVSLLSRAKIKF